MPVISPLASRSFHWAWAILAASSFTTFTYFSIRLSYGILMPEMIVSLRITKTEAGAIASSFFVAYTVLVPLLGFLIDRVDARKLITFFSLILAVGTFLMGKADSLLQACLFFFIVGIGSAAMWAPVVTLVQRWFDLRHRGKVLGLLGVERIFPGFSPRGVEEEDQEEDKGDVGGPVGEGLEGTAEGSEQVKGDEPQAEEGDCLAVLGLEFQPFHLETVGDPAVEILAQAGDGPQA